jgi:DNA polymerase III subunit delta'
MSAVFPAFFGNDSVARTLREMLAQGRSSQAILLHGPAGVGKATLVRRFAALALEANEAETARIESDDLSLPHNIEMAAERDKLPSEKRNDDPYVLASHPDFVTAGPDGPLRQVGIPQVRLLRERAQFLPLKGKRRVFLIRNMDRANEAAANSLLKVLEEPPPYLLFFLTAENAFDLLPTIRSRCLQFPMARLQEAEMAAFLRSRELPDVGQRTRLANGAPGIAVRIDLEAWAKRRNAMLALLGAASGAQPFAAWVKHAESINASKSEKLEPLMEVLYSLIEDLVMLQHQRPARNTECLEGLARIARQVSFAWLRQALKLTDEMVGNARRNVQKGLSLDAFVLSLQQYR